ncbi:hypothetical protein XELAEV_18008660mg [Xenopus laevis]|uniref:Uncharacterized protein n=1 Tax=Xenopus laevis TaxID=8355 RepID=A0A974HZU9_XENLA|nr:hypothetical protein XELAEV_18008660mg [Xenopus laevis]
MNIHKTEIMNINVSLCSTLLNNLTLDFPKSQLKNLGLIFPKDLRNLYSLTITPAINKILSLCHKFFYFKKKDNSIQDDNIPQMNLLTHFPILLKHNDINKLDSAQNGFIWSSKKPKIALSKLQGPYALGSFKAPIFTWKLLFSSHSFNHMQTPFMPIHLLWKTSQPRYYSIISPSKKHHPLSWAVLKRQPGLKIGDHFFYIIVKRSFLSVANKSLFAIQKHWLSEELAKMEDNWGILNIDYN